MQKPFEKRELSAKEKAKARLKTRCGARKPKARKPWAGLRRRRASAKAAERALETRAERAEREARRDAFRQSLWRPEEAMRMLELDVQDLGNWIRIAELKREWREMTAGDRPKRKR